MASPNLYGWFGALQILSSCWIMPLRKQEEGTFQDFPGNGGKFVTIKMACPFHAFAIVSALELVALKADTCHSRSHIITPSQWITPPFQISI